MATREATRIYQEVSKFCDDDCRFGFYITKKTNKSLKKKQFLVFSAKFVHYHQKGMNFYSEVISKSEANIKLT